MVLTPSFQSPSDVLAKLQREGYRAFHWPHPIHKADALYNFCVTALAVRDHVLDALDLVSPEQKQPHLEAWAKSEILVAAGEIANTSKHATLRRKSGTVKPVKTRGVNPNQADITHVWADNSGALWPVETTEPSYEVVLPSGAVLDLSVFTRQVLEAAKNYLTEHGFTMREQTRDEYLGLGYDPSPPAGGDGTSSPGNTDQ
jgi:hypothetical protein